MQADAQEVTRAPDGARRRLEQHESVGVLLRVGERRTREPELVVLPSLLPHRPDDVHHLPVRHPLAAGSLALLALAAGLRLAHARGDSRFRPDRDVGLHPAFPEGKAAVLIGGVACAAHAVLVRAHVAVGHDDGVDVRVDEVRVPRHRVGDAVDVVPPAGVETDEVPAQGGADLHELEGRLELLDEDVGFDLADRQPEVSFESREDVVPQSRFLGGLDLGQVENDRGSRAGQRPVIVGHVEDEVDDRRGKAGAVPLSHVAVVEVQAAGAKHLRREVELPAPVGDDGPPEEALRPLVHFLRDAFGDAQEKRVLLDRQPEVALVVERHRVDLPDCVLAVEHPAVGAREQGVGDVAQAVLGARPRPRGGPRALDPLALQIGGDLAALEPAVAGVLNPDTRARDHRLGIEEGDALAAARWRASRRAMRAAMSSRRSRLRGASASSASSAAGV